MSSSSASGWKLGVAAGVAGGCIGAAVCSKFGMSGPEKAENRLTEHRIPHGGEAESERWSATDLAAFMLRNGVSSEGALAIERENIDGTTIQCIGQGDLVTIGVAKIGDRKKIEQLVKRLAAARSVSSSSATTPSSHIVPQNPQNPLSPAAGMLPSKRQPVSQPQSQPRSRAPADTDDIAAEALESKFTELVDSHTESLARITQFLASPSFQSGTPKERKVQLAKVVQLLTKLIEFTDVLPEAHRTTLINEIQKVYQLVRKYDVPDEEEAEEEMEVKEVSGRRQRILDLKAKLESIEDGDITAVMGQLHAVVADLDNCDDPEDLKLLNEVFELLKAKEGQMRKKATLVKKEMDNNEAAKIIERVAMSAHRLETEFAKDPKGVLQEALETLTDYVNSPSHDPEVSSKFHELITKKKDELEELLLRSGAPNGRASANPQTGATLDGIISLLKDDAFSQLPSEDKFKIMEHSYQVLDKLSQAELAQHVSKTSELVSLLKKRHAETSMGAQAEINAAEAEAEALQKSGTQQPSDDDSTQSPQNEVNMLPKVYSRLQQPTFSDHACAFEFNTLLWAVAQISQVLHAVVPEDKFKELIEPVHRMLMQRMDETTQMPHSRMQPTGEYTMKKEGDDFKIYHSTHEEVGDEASQLYPTPAPVVEKSSTFASLDGEDAQQLKAPLVAILVAVDSPDGTEALEVAHLAYMLKKELGYKVVSLTGSDACKESVETAVKAVDATLVLVRSSSGTYASGESIDATELHGFTSGATGIIIDTGNSVLFSTPAEQTSVTIHPSASKSLKGTCSWLFDGHFTPIISELMTSEAKTPTTLGALVRGVQDMHVSSENASIQDRTVEAGGLDKIISYGLAHCMDDSNEGIDEDEEGDGGEASGNEDL